MHTSGRILPGGVRRYAHKGRFTHMKRPLHGDPQNRSLLSSITLLTFSSSFA